MLAQYPCAKKLRLSPAAGTITAMAEAMAIPDDTSRRALHRLIDSEEVERLRLAQQLHDGPLQDLHILDFGLVMLERRLADGDTADELARLRVELQQVSRALRDICQTIRPPALTPFGVGTVLRSYGERLAREHPELCVRLEIDDDGQRLPEDVRLALYRICQQAVANVIDHAGAGTVHIRFLINGERTILEIEDDGVGFAPPANLDSLAEAGRLGLAGSKERAEAVRGQLFVESSPGAGALVRAVIPAHALPK